VASSCSSGFGRPGNPPNHPVHQAILTLKPGAQSPDDGATGAIAGCVRIWTPRQPSGQYSTVQHSTVQYSTVRTIQSEYLVSHDMSTKRAIGTERSTEAAEGQSKAFMKPLRNLIRPSDNSYKTFINTPLPCPQSWSKSNPTFSTKQIGVQEMDPGRDPQGGGSLGDLLCDERWIGFRSTLRTGKGSVYKSLEGAIWGSYKVS
jgi:hypothetical protein